MDPLFDQDAVPSTEDRPTHGAAPVTAEEGGAEPRSDPAGPALDGPVGLGDPGPGVTADGTGPSSKSTADPKVEPEEPAQVIPPAPVVPMAPSSAGPGQSQRGRPPPKPVGATHRWRSHLTQLTIWPSPVRARSDHQLYSLVMLFVLAVTVGVLAAGTLLVAIFVIVGALGHGS